MLINTNPNQSLPQNNLNNQMLNMGQGINSAPMNSNDNTDLNINNKNMM